MLITIKDTQAEVDRYLELHEQASKIRSEMEKLKKSIREDMEEQGRKEFDGTLGKQIYLRPAKASNSTSRYTDYELKDVVQVLDGKDLKKVTEIRVNGDKLKGIMSDLPAEMVHRLESVKVVRDGTPRFSVRK